MTYFEQKDELEVMKDGLLKSYEELFNKSVEFSEKCVKLRSSFMTVDEVTNFLDTVRNDEEFQKATQVSIALLNTHIGQE